MTVEQQELLKALDYTRNLMARDPHEAVHSAVYTSLIKQLRATFHVVTANAEPEYVYSPSRAVLKRVD